MQMLLSIILKHMCAVSLSHFHPHSFSVSFSAMRASFRTNVMWAICISQIHIKYLYIVQHCKRRKFCCLSKMLTRWKEHKFELRTHTHRHPTHAKDILKYMHSLRFINFIRISLLARAYRIPFAVIHRVRAQHTKLWYAAIILIQD